MMIQSTVSSVVDLLELIIIAIRPTSDRLKRRAIRKRNKAAKLPEGSERRKRLLQKEADLLARVEELKDIGR